MGHSQWVQTVCWSKTDEYLFISGSYDNQVKLWDYRRWISIIFYWEKLILKLMNFLFTKFIYSPKAPLYDLIGHSDKVLDCDWSNPKFIVSGGADNSVRIFKSRKAFDDK